MSFSVEKSENIPTKGGFGFRKTNKIKKARKLPELISRILNIPNDKILIYDKEVAEKLEQEKRDKESSDKFNEYVNKDQNQTDSMLDSSSNPSNTSGTTPEESTSSSETSGEENDDSQKTSSKDTPIISSYSFDPSIGEEEQNKIKGLVSSLNNMLRLPELGMFGNDEIEGKMDSVIMVEKIIDDDGEKQNLPKEIYMEPLIQIVE